MPIKVEIAPGELVDKITILEIKLERITDPIKRQNITLEYQVLTQAFDTNIERTFVLNELLSELKEINGRLWSIEDHIRDLERASDFGPEFVAVARSVYRTNDERAAIKRKINELLNSTIVEEKSYAQY